MRRLVAAAVTAAFLFLSLQTAAYAADKIGYVDLNKLFEGHPRTKDYDKALEEKQGKYEKEREKKVEDIKAIQDKMGLLSDKEKEASKSKLDENVNTLREFDREQQTDLRKERDEKLAEILKDIEAAIAEYAQKDGYALILNDKVLMYQDKGLNVTDKVLEILKKGAPAKK